MSQAECDVQITVTELPSGKIKVDVTTTNGCDNDTSVALYSYADQPVAGFDPSLEQTLLGHHPNHITITDAPCGVDFQADVFFGEVLESVGPEGGFYGSRLVDSDHEDGVECAPDPTTTTSTTAPAVSTIVSVADPTSSTTQPVLPFTGGHELGALQIGAPLMIAGVILTTWSKLRFRAVPVR